MPQNVQLPYYYHLFPILIDIQRDENDTGTQKTLIFFYSFHKRKMVHSNIYTKDHLVMTAKLHRPVQNISLIQPIEDVYSFKEEYEGRVGFYTKTIKI